jgi:D-cysteine desulfhydrase
VTTGLLGRRRIRLMPGGPTPLQPAARLSEELGVEVWFKRDDLTGFGLGGNKVRGLEFLLADAEDCGCDSLVTGAGPQSNWAMLAALAANVQGLRAHIVYYGTPQPPAGNHLLACIAGTAVEFTGDTDRASVDAAIAARAAQLQSDGGRPYVLPRGGATPLGSIGYVNASVELHQQLLDAGLAPRELWLATGSCGTQAGLVAGGVWLRSGIRIVGVAVSRPPQECAARVADLAAGAAALAGSDAPLAGDVDVRGGHLGPGYGVASAAGREAAALVARTEGVFLDPVFAAKAMGALVAAARAGDVIGPVVFLVSGGAPTLFTAGQEAAA